MDDPFNRVLVNHLVQGRTQVSWTIDREFGDPGCWLAKLQWGHTGNPIANDWADVADFAPATGVLYDNEPRDDEGTEWRIHYRVVLKTEVADYTSRPTPTLASMDDRHWLQAQAIVRREQLRMQRADVARGWLFKRKREGEIPDPADLRIAVTNLLTGEIVRSQNRRTVGTEFVDGFYAPTPFRVDFQPAGTHVERDGAKTRGTIDDMAMMQRGHVVLDPPLSENDVFVVAGSDERFYIHEVQYQTLQGRIPITANVGLRLAPRSDVVYTLQVASVDPFAEEPYCG